MGSRGFGLLVNLSGGEENSNSLLMLVMKCLCCFRYRDAPLLSGSASLSQTVLLSICMHLRPDPSDRVVHLIQVLHDNHGMMQAGAGANAKSDVDWADDLWTRSFGRDDEALLAGRFRVETRKRS